MNSEQKFDQMVCLVGTNPLPVYLGIRQFVRPKGKILLIHSGDVKQNINQSTGTADVAERIQRALGTEGVMLEHLSDPYSPAAVAEKFESLKRADRISTQAALNYTGGTKVMSAFAVRAWERISGNIDETLYLQEDQGLFRFGSGRDVTLDVRLNMGDVARLHNVSPSRKEEFPACTIQDHLRVLKAWGSGKLGFDEYKYDHRRWSDLRDNQQFRMLKGQYDEASGQWTGAEWRACLDLLTEKTRGEWLRTSCPNSFASYEGDRGRRIPTSELFKQFRFFGNNGWMEMLVLSIIKSLPALPSEFRAEDIGTTPTDPLLVPESIKTGQHYFVQGQDFESDIVIVLNHRVKYISVTKSRAEAIIKEKAFEASYRASQIGGGLANYCVVSLADDDATRKCNSSLNIMQTRDKVFGLSDLQAWLNGQADGLYRFLSQ